MQCIQWCTNWHVTKDVFWLFEGSCFASLFDPFSRPKNHCVLHSKIGDFKPKISVFFSCFFAVFECFFAVCFHGENQSFIYLFFRSILVAPKLRFVAKFIYFSSGFPPLFWGMILPVFSWFLRLKSRENPPFYAYKFGFSPRSLGVFCLGFLVRGGAGSSAEKICARNFRVYYWKYFPRGL